MTALPAFSIVVPTFERRDIVLGALRSFGLLQYEGEWSVTLVVDGSIDGTAQAVRAENWPFALTVIEQANGGLAAARNAGARTGAGDILLFLDDDMRVAPDLLERHASAFREDAGAVCVAGAIGLHPETPPGFLAEGVDQWTKAALSLDGEERVFSLFGGHCAIRRDAFERIGGFDPVYTSDGGYGREDTDIAVRLQRHGSIATAPGALCLQIHAVDVATTLERARLQGRADRRFALKHPAHCEALVRANGGKRALDRFVLSPLSRIPGMAALAQKIARRASTAGKFHARRAFDIARRLSWWRGVHEAGGFPTDRTVLVLNYHAIADHSDDPVLAPFSIPRRQFEEHLASLRRRGFHFVDAEATLAVARGKAVVPRRSVLLTFDDGYCDLVATVREILAPQTIPSLAFLVTGEMGGTNRWDQPAGSHPRRLATWEEARELQRLGVTLGSHSASHANLPTLPLAEAAREIRSARDAFVREGFDPPDHFAYPFGEKNAAIAAEARAAGHIAAWGLADLRVRKGSDLFDLPRVMMHSTDTPWRFRFKTRFPTLATILRHPPFVERA